MIKRFRKVVDGLFRGGAPSIEDVKNLNKHFVIKKIVSLDGVAGEKIDRICKLLNIEHIIIPINFTDLMPIAQLLNYNLKDLLLKDSPTYVHCLKGKDRTGFVVAMYKCQFLGWSYEKALEEAKLLGFGIGVDPKIIKFYEKLIKLSDKNGDVNSADIAEQSREYHGEQESIDRSSFVPFMDPSRSYPLTEPYNSSYNQYPTRENYNDKLDFEGVQTDQMPLVGLYDSNDGIKGVGPVDNGGGFSTV